MVLYNEYKGKIKDICHGIKNNDEYAINIFADFILNQNIIDENSILIPVPQHSGKAEYTLKIAEIISKNTNAKIEDIIKSEKRITLYESKIKKQNLKLNFYTTKNIKNKGNIYLIDNVIDTFQTIEECKKLIGKATPLVYGITRNSSFYKNKLIAD